MKKPQLCIVLNPDILEKLKQQAEQDHRSLSQMARVIIENYYNKESEINNGKNQSNGSKKCS